MANCLIVSADICFLCKKRLTYRGKHVQVGEFFSLDNNSTNVEARLVNQHLVKALEQQSSFRVLDITRMSEFRADAHPSTTGGKKHDDCMHWCLPGPTDTWNDLLALSLESLEN